MTEERSIVARPGRWSGVESHEGKGKGPVKGSGGGPMVWCCGRVVGGTTRKELTEVESLALAESFARASSCRTTFYSTRLIGGLAPLVPPAAQRQHNDRGRSNAIAGA